MFGIGCDGLLGNDDMGVMLSWYVWVMFGMFLVILLEVGFVLFML